MHARTGGFSSQHTGALLSPKWTQVGFVCVLHATEAYKKMTAPLNYYDVLQVSQEASMEEIKSSFRRLALEKHPDKRADVSSEEDFRQVHAAWECLRDSREAYDEELRRKANCAQSRLDSAVVVTLSEMEEAIDDETNKVVYIYSCRCGDEIEIWPDLQSTTECPKHIVECPGCSFAYLIEQ